jgi:hypothetical protein
VLNAALPAPASFPGLGKVSKSLRSQHWKHFSSILTLWYMCKFEYTCQTSILHVFWHIFGRKSVFWNKKEGKKHYVIVSTVTLSIVDSSTTAARRSPPSWNQRLTIFLLRLRQYGLFLNIDGVPVPSRSHTHPSHSETSRSLTSSLSLGCSRLPVPRETQCMWDV